MKGEGMGWEMLIVSVLLLVVLVESHAASFVDKFRDITCDNVTLVTRKEWGARPPKKIVHMNTPVTVLFIHHTDMQSCHTKEDCIKMMRIIQDFHMDERGWNDIAYNYLIGEDGRVYEGRGWNEVGSHTLGWNDVSIAFSVMGNFTARIPNTAAIAAMFGQMDCAMSLNKLTADFKMYGHRDVRPTTCPGEAFYQLIRTWKHYDHNKPVKPTPTPPLGVKPTLIPLLGGKPTPSPSLADAYEMFKLGFYGKSGYSEFELYEKFEKKIVYN